ncbi:MAG: hypothetical protein IJU76_07180, partial [Desulfovibrionaceae bacterium]|nr:hypothetical protein [Desulfovibrionaceae bacterium]
MDEMFFFIRIGDAQQVHRPKEKEEDLLRREYMKYCVGIDCGDFPRGEVFLEYVLRLLCPQVPGRQYFILQPEIKLHLL